MRYKYLLLSLICGVDLFLTIPPTVQANPNKDILERLQNQEINEVKFRIRSKTPPLNYMNDSKNTKEGFCEDFADLLEIQLNQDYRDKSNKSIKVTPEYYEEVDDPRFDTIRKKEEADIQCGADSKIVYNFEKIDVIIFSDPFLDTGIRLLVNKDDPALSGYNLEDDHLSPDDVNNILLKLKIGVPENTTTEEVIKSTYKINPSPYKNRTEALEALDKGDIEAFASDDILLQGILRNNDKQSYVLFPSYLLSNEQYVMVLHKDNYFFKEYVNVLLKNAKEKLKERLRAEGFELPEEKQEIIDELEGEIEKQEETIQRQLRIIWVLIGLILLSLFGMWLWRKNQTICLEYDEKDFDFAAFLYSLRELSSSPNISIKITKKYVSESKKIITMELFRPWGKSKQDFKQDFQKKYHENKERDQKQLLNKNEDTKEILELETNFLNLSKLIEKQGYRDVSLTFNLGTSITNKMSKDMTAGHNIDTGGGPIGNVGTTQEQITAIGHQNNYNYAPDQNLAEAAAEIQQLLEQISQNNPTSSNREKMAVVGEVVDEIESNPTLKEKVINALKVGGSEAFKEAIDHPLVNILMATIEGWQETD